MVFFQLFDKESSTYTYILGDSYSGEAILIDPVHEMLQRDLTLIKEAGLDLKYILETHVHADHITSSGELRRLTGAKICLGSENEVPCADVLLRDGDTLDFGSLQVKTISTPGHTGGCVSYLIGNMVFTGDTLLVRGCGRTDFQSGDSYTLYSSVRDKLFTLPENTIVYPGHDYRGFTSSTIKLEKRFNLRLNLDISLDEFVHIMSNLNLSNPKKMEVAVPANMSCGLN